MKIYFNLSTSFIWHRHPVGIVRVERELAKFLAANRPDTRFCRLHADGVLRTLTFEEVAEILSEAWCVPVVELVRKTSGASAPASVNAPSATVELSALKNGLVRVARQWVPPIALPLLQRGYRALSALNQRESVVAPEEDAHNEELATADTHASVPHERLEHSVRPIPVDDGDVAAEIGTTDVFVSVGLDWDHTPIAFSRELKARTGCKLLLGCHDIVPILFPEYLYRPDVEQTFRDHFLTMGHIVDAVWANSECSRRDLLTYWQESGLNVDPARVHKVALASLGEVAHTHIASLGKMNSDRLARLRASGPFVIYVSTIERRKNHHLLVQLWKNFHRLGEPVPTLVCVGMRGWGVGDLLAEVERSSVGRSERVQFWSDVDDSLLAELYRTCEFGVFPSLYEGWGLAATELLAYGKVCVIANNSSLPEACQHLCPGIDPHDYLGWRVEILKLSRDLEYRNNLEQRIAARYINRTWLNFSAEFLEMVDAMIAPSQIGGEHEIVEGSTCSNETREGEWDLVKDQMAAVWGNPAFSDLLKRYSDRRGIRALEVGGGLGVLSALVAGMSGAEVQTTDVSDYDGQNTQARLEKLLNDNSARIWKTLNLTQEDIEQAVRRVEFVTCSAETLPFDDNTFDFVFSLNAFEHIGDPKRALAELRRVLRPGGTAFIQFSPIFTADDGSHLYSQGLLDVPWCVLLYDRQEVTRRVAARGGDASRVSEVLSSLNGFPPAYYREMFAESELQVEFVEEFCGYVLPDATVTPEYEKARTLYSDEDLRVLGFKAMLHKPTATVLSR